MSKKKTQIFCHSAGKYGGMCNDGRKMLKINNVRRQNIHKDSHKWKLLFQELHREKNSFLGLRATLQHIQASATSLCLDKSSFMVWKIMIWRYLCVGNLKCNGSLWSAQQLFLDKKLKSLFTTLLRVSSNQDPYFPSITHLHCKHITVSTLQPTRVKPPLHSPPWPSDSAAALKHPLSKNLSMKTCTE